MTHSRSVEHRPSSSFGELLRRYRAAANLTQRELAARAGLSPRTVSDLERGINQRPMLYSMRRLADVLELDDDERLAFEAAARGNRTPSQTETSAIPTTLPAPVAPFVGRDAELEGLAALLHRPDVRLLTLIGPGGTGKTRLAIEAAGAARTRFPGGVYFIPLAALTDPRLLVSTIAHALGIRESAGQTIEESLVSWLRPKQVLLLLDNLEHLVAATPEVTRLLEACPRLTVLLTSRVVLHLSGEYLFPVPPMTLPPEEEIQPGTLEQYDATALFMQRAAAVDPGFAVTPETAPLIAALCTRLDGLPLAIELAAAQCRLFAPAALLARLTAGIEEALGAGPRDAPARQQTLRDTIDWSYRLLSPEVEHLFARLSVFAGGCTIPAAQAVCGGEPVGDIDRGISHLVDATLVGQEGREEPRIGMLETIREYAAERLRELGEHEEIRKRHAETYLTLAEEAWTELMGPKQAEWLARLDTEHANLRAALAWLLEHDTDGALEMSSRLREFWRLRGYWEEGVTWLEAALARGQAAPVLIRGRALAACGWLWFCRGEHRRASSLLEESLALLRREADAALDVGRVLYSLGFMHMEMGELSEAQACFDESLDYSAEPRAIGERSATLASLSSLAYMRGDYQEAVRLAEEAVGCARESGVATRLMYALGDLGTAATGLRDYERAEDALQEALTYSRQLGAPAMSAACLGNLGELAWEQGAYARAQTYQERSVAIAREMGDSRVTAIGLHNLAKTLVSRGDARGAIELLGDGLRLIRERDGEKWVIGVLLRMFAQALSTYGRAHAAVRLRAMSGRILAEVGYTASPREREMEEELMERARTVLDEAAWQQAWDVGEAMTLEQAVDFALAHAERESSSVQARGA